MARKDYTPEQAIGMLREVEVRLSQGERIGKICRALGISEQSYYRWRRLYGGLKVWPAPSSDTSPRVRIRRCRPARGLTGAERRAGHGLAARWPRAQADGSPARSVA